MIVLTAEVGVGLINAISQVGFPIVVAGAMFWKMHEQDKRHAEQIEKLSGIINNNTLALQRLHDIIEKEDK